MVLLFDAGTYSLGHGSIGGIGLRIAELASALVKHFRTIIYCPATYGENSAVDPEVEIVTSAAHWQEVLELADATFFFDMPNPGRLSDAVSCKKLIVSENTPPVEQLEYPRYQQDGIFDSSEYRRIVETYRYQVEVSHYFIARSEVERLTLIANLCLLGRLRPSDLSKSRTLDHLVSVVPIGFSGRALNDAIACQQLAGRRRELIWTGGLWTYLNPTAAIRGVVRAKERGVTTHLRFLYASPTIDTSPALEAMQNVVEALNAESLVTMQPGGVPHSLRSDFLMKASAFICLGRPGVENETCVRLRVRDSRLYGIPLIVDAFGATARELGGDDLALVVDPDDADSVADKIIAAVEAPVHNQVVGPEKRARWVYDESSRAVVTYLLKHLP